MYYSPELFENTIVGIGTLFVYGKIDLQANIYPRGVVSCVT